MQSLKNLPPWMTHQLGRCVDFFFQVLLLLKIISRRQKLSEKAKMSVNRKEDRVKSCAENNDSPALVR